MRYTTELCLAAAEADPTWSAKLVTDALNFVEPALRTEEPDEGLYAETRDMVRRLREVTEWKSLPMDWPRIDALAQWLASHSAS